VVSFLAAFGKGNNHGAHLGIAISEAALIGPMILQDGFDVRAQHYTPQAATVPGYSVYRCADGLPISVGWRDHRSWYRLCEALGVAELGRSVELADWRSRMRHPEVERALTVEFGRHARRHWLSLLPHTGVSVAPVNDYDALLTDPQVRHRSSVHAVVDSESAARVLLSAYPAIWNGG
jgi:crotonobetainyl-CoA:carnitine CoA-transferase CaiB-like acyl-CoA transferase